jgi:hypothetical protein
MQARNFFFCVVLCKMCTNMDLFVCGFCNATVSSCDCIVADDNLWTLKDMEGNGHETPVRIAGLHAEIRIQDPLNMKQGC